MRGSTLRQDVISACEILSHLYLHNVVRNRNSSRRNSSISMHLCMQKYLDKFSTVIRLHVSLEVIYHLSKPFLPLWDYSWRFPNWPQNTCEKSTRNSYMVVRMQKLYILGNKFLPAWGVKDTPLIASTRHLQSKKKLSGSWKAQGWLEKLCIELQDCPCNKCIKSSEMFLSETRVLCLYEERFFLMTSWTQEVVNSCIL